MTILRDLEKAYLIEHNNKFRKVSSNIIKKGRSLRYIMQNVNKHAKYPSGRAWRVATKLSGIDLEFRFKTTGKLGYDDY